MESAQIGITDLFGLNQKLFFVVCYRDSSAERIAHSNSLVILVILLLSKQRTPCSFSNLLGHPSKNRHNKFLNFPQIFSSPFPPPFPSSTHHTRSSHLQTIYGRGLNLRRSQHQRLLYLVQYPVPSQVVYSQSSMWILSKVRALAPACFSYYSHSISPTLVFTLERIRAQRRSALILRMVASPHWLLSQEQLPIIRINGSSRTMLNYHHKNCPLSRVKLTCLTTV